MIETPLYRHVLFKDLEPYLKRTDYFKGFNTTEQAWIRKNIGAASSSELQQLSGKVSDLTYSDLHELIVSKSLVPGTLYLINDFQTIYQSEDKNDEDKYITWGKDINPSLIYTLITMAITDSLLLSSVIILSDDEESVYWDVKYDVTSETLDDGCVTKGKIIYMSDNNFNLANYDFKNILYNIDGEVRHIFRDDGNCKNNNLCFCKKIVLDSDSSNNTIYGENVIINIPINNLVGELKNIKIDTDEIDLDNETIKSTILIDGIYNIDYLDLETLTHLFYALANNMLVTL